MKCTVSCEVSSGGTRSASRSSAYLKLQTAAGSPCRSNKTPTEDIKKPSEFVLLAEVEAHARHLVVQVPDSEVDAAPLVV